MLLEVGFQAGQHEILADAFSKDIAQQIFDEAKQMKKNRQTNMKQSKKISDELTMAFKTMTAANTVPVRGDFRNRREREEM